MHAPATLLPLVLQDVAFSAGGRELVAGFDLSVGPGAPTIILGPNGAGKSLVLRLMHGLLQPSRGRVLWLGPAAQNRESLRFGQAMVFQKPVLLRRSVLANVLFPLKLRGLDGTSRQERAMAALQRVGLAGLAERPARVLSGGEQQRLALARAWSLQPQIVFLDEPTASLDPGATRQVEEIVAGFAREGVKVVMTTHDLGQAKRLAGDIIFLHDGRMAERTPAAEFFDSPRSDAAKAFLNGQLTW